MLRYFLPLLFLFCLLPTPETHGADYTAVGKRVSAVMKDGVAVTSGSIRVRRRHENDMDFGKYNPFYWEGRRAWFEVRDYTAKGEEKIEFELWMEWPQDHDKYRGADLSAIYTGDPLAHETERSKFAINTRMDHVKGFTHFKKTLGEGAFAAHRKDLTKGRRLTFEFRFFNDEEHEGWARQKERNPHNLSAYYSEFFRIVLGEPGLLIDNFHKPGELPPPSRYSGGWTTTPTTRVEPWTALQQQAFNLRPQHAEAFLVGRSWFHADLQSGKHVGDDHDDKPSVFFEEEKQARGGRVGDRFNALSCNACHLRNGGFLLPDEDHLDQPIDAFVFRTVVGPANPHGRQIQTRGDKAEALIKVARYEKKTVKLDDGTEVELSKPIFSVDGAEDVLFSPRRPPALIGMGLLDLVPAESLPEGRNASRFGWKADVYSLQGQIESALVLDMGVGSHLGEPIVDDVTSKWPSIGYKGAYRLSPAEMKEQQERLEKLGKDRQAAPRDAILPYVALLGVPPRTRPEDPEVVAGEKVFHSIGCATCHKPTFRTHDPPTMGRNRTPHPLEEFKELQEQTIHPYTDLAVHDMGPGLSDPAGFPKASFWRTAPLWGLKNTRDAASHHRDKFAPGNVEVTYEQTHKAARANRVQLLHDGRARSIPEAILWHGGEADGAVATYKALSKKQRDQLEAFLWDL